MPLRTYTAHSAKARSRASWTDGMCPTVSYSLMFVIKFATMEVCMKHACISQT